MSVAPSLSVHQSVHLRATRREGKSTVRPIAPATHTTNMSTAFVSPGYPGKRVQRLKDAGVLVMTPLKSNRTGGVNHAEDSICIATGGIAGLATHEQILGLPARGSRKGVSAPVRLYTLTTKGGGIADGRRAHMTEVVTEFHQRVKAGKRR